MTRDLVASRLAEQREREAAEARTPWHLAWRQLKRYKAEVDTDCHRPGIGALAFTYSNCRNSA